MLALLLQGIRSEKKSIMNVYLTVRCASCEAIGKTWNETSIPKRAEKARLWVVVGVEAYGSRSKTEVAQVEIFGSDTCYDLTVNGHIAGSRFPDSDSVESVVAVI